MPILFQMQKGGPIAVRRPDHCIVCGHCVDVCPTQSVRHSEIPQEKVHPVRYDMMPTAEQLMELIHARRSNRTMDGRPVDSDKLEKIVEAGRYAPTAENTRQVTITVVTDPDKLRDIIRFTVDTFAAVVKKLENPLVKLFMKPRHPEYYELIPTFRSLQQACEKGADPILRNASAVIAYTTPKGAFGEKDSNLAYQNSSLMAQALGISQVYLGFVCAAIARGNKQRIRQILGVEGEIHALMGIGRPTMKYTNYTER